MADRETEQPDGPDARRRELRARREQQRGSAGARSGAGGWSPASAADRGRRRSSRSSSAAAATTPARTRSSSASAPRSRSGTEGRGAGREPRPQRDPAAGLGTAHRAGADPRVPRARGRARRRALPGAVRDPARLPPGDGLARRPRLPGGDPGRGRGRLVPRRHAAGEAGRRLLRRRLPAPVHLRPAGAAQARLARGAEPEGGRLGPLREQRQGDARRRLGARLAHDRPLRPDHPRRRRPAARSGRLARRSCGANTASRSRTSATRPAGSTRP